MLKNAMIVVELATDSATSVLEHALDLLASPADCTVVHVVEPQNVQYTADPTWHHEFGVQYKADAIESARKRLTELCEPFGIDPAQQHVLFGHVAAQVHEFAVANGSTCIMMGTHGTRGWRRILGSTAQSVLHGTPTHVWLFHLPLKSRPS